jgi:hypothetical protein
VEAKVMNALKKEVAALKAKVKDAEKRADALGKLSAKRGTAIARFIGGWDKKAHSAVSKAMKSKKKK